MKAFFIPVGTVDRRVRPKIKTKVAGQDERGHRSGRQRSKIRKTEVKSQDDRGNS